LSIFRRIKGTQDILPEQTWLWRIVEERIHKWMQVYNYSELRTPAFEKTELFARGIGQATDIVSKEMYTFLDRGKKSLTLKPEMTAPIIRAYIENNLSSSSMLNKLYYIAPLFRQENPQAGRLRQFNQFGAEAIGSDSPEIDAEIILLAMQIYKDLGIKNLNLLINTVDSPESRDKYKLILKEYIKPNLQKYCRDCQARFESNPLRILDCKVETCRYLNKDAPRLIDHLSETGKSHFESVKFQLEANKIHYDINPYLVRGLDYYTHTVFEITSENLGSQDAICGGGRYDLLTKQLGGQDTPAVGFASGIERLLMVMAAQEILPEKSYQLEIYICILGDNANQLATEWVQKLRMDGWATDRDYLGRSLKAQMREANRQKSRMVLILGDNEISNKEFSVKNMESGQQENISFNDIQKYLSEQLNN
jgi:histidyl-tRNA synthetase